MLNAKIWFHYKKKNNKKYLSHNENLTKMYTFLNWSYLCTYRRVYRFHLFVHINGFLGMKLFFIEECSFFGIYLNVKLKINYLSKLCINDSLEIKVMWPML